MLKFLSSVGISVYRFLMIFQSADIAGIVIEKILPYRLFPICKLFQLLLILKMYIEIISIKYLISTVEPRYKEVGYNKIRL